MLSGETFYDGSPELKEKALEQIVSPWGSMGGFALGAANVVILIGAAVVIAGAALAVILYCFGNKKK